MDAVSVSDFPEERIMKRHMTVLVMIFAASAAEATDSMLTLSPIEIVSAKSVENDFDTAGSMDVIDAEELAQRNVGSWQQLSATLPNTNISGIGTRMDTTFTIRGITNYVAAESSVSMYVDDVPVPMSYGFAVVPFYGIEQIEVLKGPQGTLYGKSTESGVVNISTAQPTKIVSTEVMAGAGGYNTREFYGKVSGPVKRSDVRLLLSAFKNAHDGFATNTFFNSDADYRDMKGMTLKLDYDITSDTQISLKYNRTDTDDGGTAFSIDSKAHPYEINEPFKDYVKTKASTASVKLTHKSGNLKITSVTAQSTQNIDRNDYIELSGGVVMDIDVAMKEFVEELKLNYIGKDYELLTGIFYSEMSSFDYRDSDILQTLPLKRTWDIQIPDKELAFYTQYKRYFYDRYVLTLGLRHQRTARELDRSYTDFLGATTPAQSSHTWTHWLPKATLSYYADKSNHFYASYAQGYRPGTYNYRSGGSNPLPVEPQMTQSYEIGYKHLSKHHRLSTAVFYNEITDMRSTTFADDLSTTVISSPHAHTYGAELSWLYLPDQKFQFQMTAGTTQAIYDDLHDGGRDLSGNHVIDVPDYTASFAGKYFLSDSVFAQGDLRYIGRRYYDIANEHKEPFYTVVNAGLGYETKNLKCLLYANNVFDRKYVDFMIPTPSNSYYHFASPRVIGFTVQYFIE